MLYAIPRSTMAEVHCVRIKHMNFWPARTKHKNHHRQCERNCKEKKENLCSTAHIHKNKHIKFKNPTATREVFYLCWWERMGEYKSEWVSEYVFVFLFVAFFHSWFLAIFRLRIQMRYRHTHARTHWHRLKMWMPVFMCWICACKI